MSDRKRFISPCVFALIGCYFTARGASWAYDTYGEKGWGFVLVGAAAFAWAILEIWLSRKKFR
jgi:hypothetical protein